MWPSSLLVEAASEFPKNVKEFCGKPMIAWPITIAKDSGLFSKILVSTDDEEIAEISIAQGADVPFLRPKSLARDDTPTEPVITHALLWLKKIIFILKMSAVFMQLPLLCNQST